MSLYMYYNRCLNRSSVAIDVTVCCVDTVEEMFKASLWRRFLAPGGGHGMFRVTPTCLTTAWVTRQGQDPFVHRARREGFACRSAFKLEHIEEKFRVLSSTPSRQQDNPGKSIPRVAPKLVVDLGASPGSWSQYVQRTTQRANSGASACRIISVDLNPMDASIAGACFIRGDFTTNEVQQRLNKEIAEYAAAQSPATVGDPLHIDPVRQPSLHVVDVVLSDMCPNRVGSSLDHQRITQLAFQAFLFAKRYLRRAERSLKGAGGNFVCKVLGNDAWTTPMMVDAEQLTFLQCLASNFDNVQICKPPASREESDESFLVALGFHGGESRFVVPSTNLNDRGISASWQGKKSINERKPREVEVAQLSKGLDRWPGLERPRQRNMK